MENSEENTHFDTRAERVKLLLLHTWAVSLDSVLETHLKHMSLEVLCQSVGRRVNDESLTLVSR